MSDNPPDRQLNLFVSTELTDALKKAAESENARLSAEGITRARITKSGLAFEILTWGFSVYSQVGSLRALKQLEIPGQIDIAKQANTSRGVYERHHPESKPKSDRSKKAG